MKTSRVEYLLQNIGSLEGDDLKEAQDVAKSFFEISDDEPIPYDRKKHPQGPDLPVDGGMPTALQSWPDPADLVRGAERSPGSQRGEAEYGRDDAPPDRVRIAQLEATVKDLYAKLTALEARLGVAKDG